MKSRKIALTLLGMIAMAIPNASYSQNINKYIESMLNNPEIATRLRSYQINYAKDPSVKESALRDYNRLCEAGKISMYRGGGGWSETVLKMTIVYNETKNWDAAAMGLFTYKNMDKLCYQYK